MQSLTTELFIYHVEQTKKNFSYANTFTCWKKKGWQKFLAKAKDFGQDQNYIFRDGFHTLQRFNCTVFHPVLTSGYLLRVS
jgi:hypothetical protein